MRQKKVLIVTQMYPPDSGGNASRISDIAGHLKTMGMEIRVICAPPTFPFGAFKRMRRISMKRDSAGVEVINLWTWQPRSRDPGFLARMAYYLIFALHALLWATVNSRDYDVVITSSPPIFVNFMGILLRFTRKPWVVDIRDLWIDASITLGFIKENSLYERVSRRLENYYYAHSNAIAVTSIESKNRILARYAGLDPDKIIVVSNGVDTERFYPCAKEKKRQLIYTGNIGYAQDLESVILAMKRVSGESDMKLVIVGDGDMKGRLVQLVDDNRLGDRVIFKDPVPRGEIPRVISESCIGVAPLKKLDSLDYAIPTKVYEYMACGIPFIGCGRGEIVNIAKESDAGIIVDNDPDAIAKTILDLSGDPRKMAEMGEKGISHVKKHYDRKAIAGELKAYLDTFLPRSHTENEVP